MTEADSNPIRSPEPPRKNSPLAPGSVANLFFRPSLFFAPGSRVLKKPELLIVIWLAGLAYTSDRLDARLMAADAGGSSPRMESVALFAEHWGALWTFCILTGVPAGFLVWWIFGWWYRKRLTWSQAESPHAELARAVWAYQNLVVALPSVLLLLVQTGLFSNYREARESEEWWPMVWIAFPFWSCVTSYKAVLARFSVSRTRARFWFLILPIGFYVVVSVGVLGILYTTVQ